jgi:FKBP-type peptidyl-prolyl cis-trans isomerase FkpA
MKRLLFLISILILLLGSAANLSANNQFIQTASGLEYKDLKIGNGPEAGLKKIATIHFVGWLSDNGQRGKEIYNSRKEKEPVSFVIGTDQVMQGWNEGVIGMKTGGMRMLRLPPGLAYGAKAIDNVVPAHASLIFIIELLEVR